MRILIAALAALFIAFTALVVIRTYPVVDAANPMRIEDAYMRSSGVNAMAGAAFLEITNQSGKQDRLLAASTEVANIVELHTHIEDANGIMMMRQIEDGIEISAGEKVNLERGGDHIMLMGLNRSLVEGETVKIILTFEKAGNIEIPVPVNNNK